MNSTVAFTFDPNWQVILGSTFMVRAMIAGVLISLSAGVIGYFVIARKSTFAAHAVAHIGIPGATGAVLLGLPVSLGMGVFALAGSLIIVSPLINGRFTTIAIYLVWIDSYRHQ